MNTRRSLRSASVQSQSNNHVGLDQQRSSPLKIGGHHAAGQMLGSKLGQSKERRAFGDITNKKGSLLGKVTKDQVLEKGKGSENLKSASVSLRKKAVELEKEQLIDFDVDQILDNAQQTKITNLEDEEEDMEVEYFHGDKDSELIFQEHFQKIADIPEPSPNLSFLNNYNGSAQKYKCMERVEVKPLDEINTTEFVGIDDDFDSLIEEVDINFDIEVKSLSDIDEE
jgi:hypothetical protein